MAALTLVTSDNQFSYNLTTLGTLDWVRFKGTTVYRKTGGNSIIGTFHRLDDTVHGMALTSTDGATLSFSDGIGTTSDTSTDGLQGSFYPGQGLVFTLPADTYSKTYSILLTFTEVTLTVSASLSDGSATAVSDGPFTLHAGPKTQRIVVTAQAATAGQFVRVVVKLPYNSAVNYTSYIAVGGITCSGSADPSGTKLIGSPAFVTGLTGMGFEDFAGSLTSGVATTPTGMGYTFTGSAGVQDSTSSGGTANHAAPAEGTKSARFTAAGDKVNRSITTTAGDYVFTLLAQQVQYQDSGTIQFKLDSTQVGDTIALAAWPEAWRRFNFGPFTVNSSAHDYAVVQTAGALLDVDDTKLLRLATASGSLVGGTTPPPTPPTPPSPPPTPPSPPPTPPAPPPGPPAFAFTTTGFTVSGTGYYGNGGAIADQKGISNLVIPASTAANFGGNLASVATGARLALGLSTSSTVVYPNSFKYGIRQNVGSTWSNITDGAVIAGAYGVTPSNGDAITFERFLTDGGTVAHIKATCGGVIVAQWDNTPLTEVLYAVIAADGTGSFNSVYSNNMVVYVAPPTPPTPPPTPPSPPPTPPAPPPTPPSPPPTPPAPPPVGGSLVSIAGTGNTLYTAVAAQPTATWIQATSFQTVKTAHDLAVANGYTERGSNSAVVDAYSGGVLLQSIGKQYIAGAGHQDSPFNGLISISMETGVATLEVMPSVISNAQYAAMQSSWARSPSNYLEFINGIYPSESNPFTLNTPNMTLAPDGQPYYPTVIGPPITTGPNIKGVHTYGGFAAYGQKVYIQGFRVFDLSTSPPSGTQATGFTPTAGVNSWGTQNVDQTMAYSSLPSYAVAQQDMVTGAVITEYMDYPYAMGQGANVNFDDFAYACVIGDRLYCVKISSDGNPAYQPPLAWYMQLPLVTPGRSNNTVNVTSGLTGRWSTADMGVIVNGVNDDGHHVQRNTSAFDSINNIMYIPARDWSYFLTWKPLTGEMGKMSMLNTGPATRTNSAYGRLQFRRSRQVFSLVNEFDQKPYLFRASEFVVGVPPPPPAPSSPPTPPSPTPPGPPPVTPPPVTPPTPPAPPPTPPTPPSPPPVTPPPVTPPPTPPSPPPGGTHSRTATITLESAGGVPLANESGLLVAFFEQAKPDLFMAPVYKTASASTNGSGVLTITIPATTLAVGGIGWIDVTNSNGNPSMIHRYFGGPVAVS